jgi:hypothetical protein
MLVNVVIPVANHSNLRKFSRNISCPFEKLIVIFVTLTLLLHIYALDNTAFFLLSTSLKMAEKGLPRVWISNYSATVGTLLKIWRGTRQFRYRRKEQVYVAVADVTCLACAGSCISQDTHYHEGIVVFLSFFRQIPGLYLPYGTSSSVRNSF